MADWLSKHNHEIGKDKKIPRMGINKNAIETCMNNPECMTAEETQLVTIDDEHISIFQ